MRLLTAFLLATTLLLNIGCQSTTDTYLRYKATAVAQQQNVDKLDRQLAAGINTAITDVNSRIEDPILDAAQNLSDFQVVSVGYPTNPWTLEEIQDVSTTDRFKKEYNDATKELNDTKTKLQSYEQQVTALSKELEIERSKSLWNRIKTSAYGLTAVIIIIILLTLFPGIISILIFMMGRMKKAFSTVVEAVEKANDKEELKNELSKKMNDNDKKLIRKVKSELVKSGKV